MTTNHQETAEPGPALATSSPARKAALSRLQGQELGSVTEAFLRPPLYHRDFTNWFGTLYTAAYSPTTGTARYFWPDEAWEQSIEHFAEGHRTRRFIDTGAPEQGPAE